MISGPEPTLEARGFVLRRNWILPGAFAAFALWGVWGVWMLNHVDGRWAVALFGVIVGGPMALVTAARDAFPLRRAARVQIDARGLVIDEGAPIPPDEIVEAKLVPKPGGAVDTVVELGVGRARPRRLRLWLPRPDAERMLAHLGTLPGERRTPFSIVLPFWKRFLGAYGALALLFLALSVPTWPSRADVSLLVFSFLVTLLTTLPMLALVAAGLLGYVRGKVLVGAEGFATRWLGRERFVAFKDVLDVSAFGRAQTAEADTLVRLRGGKRLRLRPVEEPDTHADRGTSSRALTEHLDRAFGRFQALAGRGVELRHALAREGRDGAAWLAGLDALARGGGARYRVAAIDPDELLRVAEDPNTAAEARAGAAAVLRRVGEGRHRARVRVAAIACAEPDLRLALGELAEAESDEAIAAALGRIR